jgi:hypothetical protein
MMEACQATLGPNAIHRGTTSYNEAIIRVADEQLLLNLVRLHYRDNPLFVDIGSITAQQSVSGTVGFEADLTSSAGAPFSALLKAPIAGTYTESPTVIFSPLQGEAFSRRLLSPLPPTAILLLSSSGWSVIRVFELVLDRVNNLRNADTAAGPTPELAPEFSGFQTLLSSLRALQINDALTIGETTENGRSQVVLRLHEDPHLSAELDRVHQWLGKPSAQGTYAFTTDVVVPSEGRIAIRTRSLLSVMFFLSQMVEVPSEDVKAGLVTSTRKADGTPFDWRELSKGVFSVRASNDRPAHAYVAVPYRNHWFSIADDDLNSKSTFMLLMELFNTQAGQPSAPGPQLTLPLSH